MRRDHPPYRSLGNLAGISQALAGGPAPASRKWWEGKICLLVQSDPLDFLDPNSTSTFAITRKRASAPKSEKNLEVGKLCHEPVSASVTLSHSQLLHTRWKPHYCAFYLKAMRPPSCTAVEDSLLPADRLSTSPTYSAGAMTPRGAAISSYTGCKHMLTTADHPATSAKKEARVPADRVAVSRKNPLRF